jgi:apolipoprotein N-acyltransferase
MQGPRRAAAAALLAIALVWPAPPSWTTPAGTFLWVAAVDLPASTDSRWTLQARDAALEAMHRTLRQAADGSVIVTPEMVLGEPPPHTPEGVWADLMDALAARGQRLLVGTALPHPDEPDLMNAALLLAPRGGEVSASVYAKQRMAPIGEQLPWPALFAPVADRWFNHGQRTSRPAGPAALAEPLLVDGTAVGLLICHEVAFGDLPAAHAESLVHLSSDPRAAQQSLALARMRALESGKWLLSVSEGRPAVRVDPLGQVHEANGTVWLPARQGSTPYVHWRALQPWAPLLVLAALLLAGRRRAPAVDAPRPTLAGTSP